MRLGRSITPPVVLVVEDEPLVRMTAADELDEAGFPVLEAKNADEAIAVLEAHADEVQVLFLRGGLQVLTADQQNRVPAVAQRPGPAHVRQRVSRRAGSNQSDMHNCVPASRRRLAKPCPRW